MNSVWDLFHASRAHYFSVLKKIFLPILLIALTKNISFYLSLISSNFIWQIILLVTTIIIFVYLWAVSFLMTDHVLQQKPISLGEAMQAILARLLSMIIILLCIFVTLMIFVEFARWLQERLTSPLFLLFFVGFPLLLIMVVFYLALPFVVLENIWFWQGFKKSALLVKGKNWMKVFVIYCISVFIVLFISPSSFHSYWLGKHYLGFIFDMLFLSLTLPIFNTMLSLLLSSLKNTQE